MLETAPRSLPRSLWWFALTCVLALGSFSLMYPFGRDQGNYAYSAFALLDGRMLYSDVYVFKPPMTTITHAVSTVLLGQHQAGIRIFDLGLVTLTCGLLASVAYRLSGRVSAAVGVCLAYPFCYYNLKYWDLAQTDGFLNLWLALALLLLVVASDQLDAGKRGSRPGCG